MKDKLDTGAEAMENLILRASAKSPEEIVETAEALSLTLRQENIFGAFRELVAQPDLLSHHGFPSIRMAERSENNELLAKTNVSKGCRVVVHGGELAHTIFIKAPCSKFQLNKTLSLLLANCCLHLEGDGLRDGEYFFTSPSQDAIESDTIRQQAVTFAEAFMMPRPLVDSCMKKQKLRFATIANYLHVRPSDFRSAYGLSAIRHFRAVETNHSPQLAVA